ncbi:hypothetical protein [Paraburkholderia acidipaludis]|uniref:hypothetical protein n=1 Tax=Paraburkholderia acidipaludis TaxID=660537 RepID=UPI000488C01E|nr:hypothetical protein [Paraburkholderia acidipaludis]
MSDQSTSPSGKNIVAKRVFVALAVGLVLWIVLRLPANTLPGAFALLVVDVVLVGALLWLVAWVILKVVNKMPAFFPTLKHALKRDLPWLMCLTVLMWLLHQF